MVSLISLDWWEDIYSRLSRFLVYLSSVALCGMATMITIDVALRYFFNSPLPASVEISQLVEPWVIFLPFAYTLAVGGHVQVTLVTMRLPARWQQACDIFAYTVDFLFFTVLCWFSWIEFANSFAIGEIMLAAVKLPWWAGKLAMPLGMLCIGLQCVFQILSTVKKFRGR